MSLTRITDRHRADWPVTGKWCDTCGMPLAVDAPDRVHPGCQPAEPDLTDAEHVELVALLVRTLGAHSPDPMALGTWRRTGRPVVAA